MLARYGRDSDGNLYLHVKVYKQSRIFGEYIVTGQANVNLRCRDCLRWFMIRLHQDCSPPLEIRLQGPTSALVDATRS